MSEDNPFLCVDCRFFDKHCFGKMESCQCGCVAHMLKFDDIRFDLIAILGAEANEDSDMLVALIKEMDEDKMRVLLLLLVQYVTWMLRKADIDPVQTVQTAALYWSGADVPGLSDDDEAPDNG